MTPEQFVIGTVVIFAVALIASKLDARRIARRVARQQAAFARDHATRVTPLAGARSTHSPRGSGASARPSTANKRTGRR